MSTGKFDINELKRRMQGATQALKHELGGLRTGRASAYLCATLTSSLRRSWFSSGMRRRSTWPSVAGESPRLESTIAFSTGLTIDLSQTWTEISRGSGTLTVASWLSGMWVP